MGNNYRASCRKRARSIEWAHESILGNLMALNIGNDEVSDGFTTPDLKKLVFSFRNKLARLCVATHSEAEKLGWKQPPMVQQPVAVMNSPVSDEDEESAVVADPMSPGDQADPGNLDSQSASVGGAHGDVEEPVLAAPVVPVQLIIGAAPRQYVADDYDYARSLQELEYTSNPI